MFTFTFSHTTPCIHALDPCRIALTKIANQRFCVAFLLSLFLHAVVVGYGFFTKRIIASQANPIPAALKAVIMSHQKTSTQETQIPVVSEMKETSETKVALPGQSDIKKQASHIFEQEPLPSLHSSEQTVQKAFSTEEDTVNMYHSVTELTVAPSMIGKPMIDLPVPIGGGAPPTGRLVLKIAISTSGLVDWIEVEQSTLPPIFDAVISNAFRTVHYSPAEINGKKTAAILFMEVRIDDGNSPVQMISPDTQTQPEKENPENYDMTNIIPETPGAMQK